MPLADDLGQYLENVGLGLLAPVGAAVTNEDIFTEQMPDSPDDVIFLKRQAGIGPLRVMESFSSAIEKPGLQVRVRGAKGNHVATEARAEAVRDAIDKVRDFTINGSRYMFTERAGDLGSLGEDANGRREYGINFIVWQVSC